MALVVECGKCGTRFQLDTSRIPDAGIRVRCSRCKHAFFLQHPSQSVADAVDAVAEEAIQNASVPAPQPTHDLSGQTGPGAAGADADEEDWEFNEDPLPDDDSEDYDGINLDDDVDFDLEGEVEAIAAEAFDEDDDVSDGIELADTDAETVMGESSGVNLDGREIGVDDLAAGNMSADAVEVEGLDDEPEDDEVPESDAGPAPGFGGVRESEAFGSMEDYSGSPAEPMSEEPVTAAPASEQEDIEDPESWDFFGDDAQAAKGVHAAGSSSPVVESVSALSEVDPATIGVDAESEWRAYERQGPVGAVGRIISAVMTVVVFGMLGGGIYLGVTGSFDSGVRAPAFVDVGEMRAANIRGQWVETESVGTLYVVSGDLLNPGKTLASPDHAVRVTLLGEDGNALDVGSAYAGVGWETDALRQIAQQDLLPTQLSAARTLTGQAIAPGDSVRIAAAFVDLPREATHFALDAVEPGALDAWAREAGVAMTVEADAEAQAEGEATLNSPRP